MKIYNCILVIVVVILCLFLIQNNFGHLVSKGTDVQTNVQENKIKFVKIVDKVLKTELALTQEVQEKGLSDRDELKEDEAMLFIFDNNTRHSFWMKDMNFAIDIIWVDKDLNVVYIKENAQPESYPEIFSPEVDAKYVLEVIPSFSSKNNLKVGEKVKFLSY